MLVYSGSTNLFTHEYTKELQKLLEEDYDEARLSDTHSHFSYILDKTLAQSGVGDIFELINFTITFVLIIFYIINTYTYPENTESKILTNKRISTVEIYLCVILIVHFVIKFYINQSRLMFIFDYTSLVDYSSIIFIILSKQSFVSEDLKYLFRLFRVFRILYLFKLEYILQKKYNETVRYTYKLLIYGASIIFVATSLILEIENLNYRQEHRDNNGVVHATESIGNKAKSKIFQFHDMVYFMFVTMTTIGFGDVTPVTWISRYIVIVTICLLLVVVLPVYSKLNIIFALTSKYSRMNYQKKSQKFQHLIVLGECGMESFEAFLEELYDDDHGRSNYDTVIMQSSPNEELMKLIKGLNYTNRICYLVGNSLVHRDLERCKADKSVCAVILANKLAKNPRLEDFSNIMKAFSFRKFSYIYGSGEDTRICIQLLRPETKEIYFSSLINTSEINNRDQIICVEEIKLQLLGKSCLCPGITTIISSLITSKKPSMNEEEAGELPDEMKWLSEYLAGIQLEIYVVNLRAELIHNMKFIDLVKLIYEISGYVVIGIDVIIDDIKPFVCLNPSGYLVSPFDHVVYVLASNAPDEADINNKIKEHLEKNNKGIVENNIEMVKLLRMKNPFWNKMGNSNEYSKGKEGNGNNNGNQKPDSNPNNMNANNMDENNYASSVTLMKDELDYPKEKKRSKNGHKKKASNLSDSSKNYGQNNNSVSSYKKKLDNFSSVRQNFLHTVLPRTQHEAENFSPDILDHHIIVCGIGLNLKNLLMPLRASTMKNQQYPIIIIDKAEHIPSEIWKEIQYYPDIYFMQGNPIKSKDLHKAGIKKAKAVIILSKSTSDLEQADMVDADTIFIYKAIKNETKTALIIAELVSISSIGFINSVDDTYVRKQGYWLSEPFAVGEIYISSMLDTLICQSFYNPYITDILQQLIMGSSSNNFNFRVLRKLQEKKIEQSTLYLFNTNEEIMKLGGRDFPKKVKFKDLFHFFVKNNMVPIGINRNSAKIASIRSKNDKRYVFLCPKGDTEVDIDHDKIYILAGEEFIKKENDNDPYKNKTNTNYQFNKTSKLIDKSNELVLELATGVKELLDKNSMTFKRAYSIKKVVNCVRSSMRNELSIMHDKLGESDEDDEKEEEEQEEPESQKSSFEMTEGKDNDSNKDDSQNENAKKEQ